MSLNHPALNVLRDRDAPTHVTGLFESHWDLCTAIRNIFARTISATSFDRAMETCSIQAVTASLSKDLSYDLSEYQDDILEAFGGVTAQLHFEEDRRKSCTCKTTACGESCECAYCHPNRLRSTRHHKRKQATENDDLSHDSAAQSPLRRSMRTKRVTDKARTMMESNGGSDDE